MSKAEELLNTLAITETTNARLSTIDEPHLVIGPDRIITVPTELKRLAVQFDHNVETVTFDCPRYWDEHDMSQMHIYINYLRPDKESGIFKAQDVTVDELDETMMHFTWTISRHVTEVPGQIVFLVCIKIADAEGNEKTHWNSELCKTCFVSEGLEIDGEPIRELYPDIIENWYSEVVEVLDEVNAVKQNVIEMRDSGAFDGATFTPTVDSDGNISWTNDRGRPNPKTVNITGPNGVSPVITITRLQGGYRLTITDIEGTKSFDIMDTIIDDTEAVKKVINDFVYIGSIEPAEGPVLWLDSSVENNVLMKFKDMSGDVTVTYPITKKDNVIGLGDAIRNQSVTTTGTSTIYEATVSGITELTSGIGFVMIPHVTSAASSPKLNVNGLGEKFIRRRVSGSTTTTYSEKTSDDWLAAGKPIWVVYDGTQWIADMPVPYAGDFMGTLAVNNGGTGATTAAQARINLGIETADGTVSSGNAVYAEVGEWLDGNPDGEDRIGYFVCVDNNTPGATMRKATADDDVRGVTVAAPAFSGNCSSDKFDSDGNLLARYSFVAVMGMVSVIDNGTCTVNGRCMPNANSTASPVDGDYGYQVIERIDDTHILIAVEPGTDTQYNFKNYIDDNKESKKLVFNNVAVATSAFVSDTTYSDYGYRAAISLDGVNSSMIPEVMFDADIAASGDFSSVSATYDGGVYIYSASVPSSEIIIPTIVCWSRDSGTEASIPSGGGNVTGNLYMNGYSISGLNDPTDSTQAANKNYVDKMLPKTGGAMTGAISMGTNRITDLGTPAANTDAATKGYVDLAAYPVGAIYISTVSTSPASLFGGTWEQIKDRFLYSVGDTAFAGQQGGEISHTLTVNEMPPHQHSVYADADFSAYNTGNNNEWKQALVNVSNPVTVDYMRIGSSGGGWAHNNMPPYLVVYMWKRVS